MKQIIILLTLVSNIAFAADEWFGCAESKVREECDECFKSKAPGDKMKWLEEMYTPYEKANEVRDKNGNLQSIKIIKSPGNNTAEEIFYFYKDKKKCELECGKRHNELVEASKARKANEDKKFEDYK